MVVALIALFVALGGSAAALSGSNTVFSDDIANDTFNSPTQGQGGLVAADLRPSSVGTSEIQNGQVSVLDTNKVIPSGATVTGAFRESEDDSSSGTGVAELQFSVDFHGLRAPTRLTDADINFDDIGISQDASGSNESSTGCTGGLATPTAPPGKVCIYLFEETIVDNTAQADALAQGSAAGFTEPNDKGFWVSVSEGPSNRALLGGTWAYRAP